MDLVVACPFCSVAVRCVWAGSFGMIGSCSGIGSHAVARSMPAPFPCAQAPEYGSRARRCRRKCFGVHGGPGPKYRRSKCVASRKIRMPSTFLGACQYVNRARGKLPVPMRGGSDAPPNANNPTMHKSAMRRVRWRTRVRMVVLQSRASSLAPTSRNHPGAAP